jgi:PAS domain S-box-containing protein/putative nucleotidyltransferase with HDIG domain
MKLPRLRLDIHIALTYAIFGGLWILFTDSLLAWLVDDPIMLTLLQTYKGWAFVLISALLIYTLLRRYLRLRESSQRTLEASLVEKLHAETQLRQLSRAVEQSPVSIVITDLAGNIQYVNPKFTEVTGYSAAEVMGQNPRILKSGVTSAQEYTMLWELITQGEEWHGEFQNRRKDGTIYWEQASISPIFDAQGQISNFVGIKEDITARKQLEAQMHTQLSRLQTLREIDLAITASFEMSSTLQQLVQHATRELHVDAAAILVYNSDTVRLEYAAGHGFRTRIIEQSALRLDQGQAGRVALDRRLRVISDLRTHSVPFVRTELLHTEEFVSYIGVPLITKGMIKGVLEVFQRTPFDPPQEWLDFLQTLAGQAAIAVESAQLFTTLQRSNMELLNAYEATIEGWSRALDLRDKETEGHSLRVTELTLAVAQRFGMSSEELKYVRWGSLLHDIGKMGIPDEILLKPGSLTDAEWIVMRQHPTLAYEMLAPIRYLKDAALDIPYCHHEKWDGSGYPRGLKGEQIPLAARIFAIVDVWDALCSDRPYRTGWPEDRVLAHIQAQAGNHFDPQLVPIFLEVIEQRSVIR